MKKKFMIPAWATLVLMLITAALPDPAVGYVLEGPHILDLTAKAMGKIVALEVQQKVLIYPQDPDTSPTVFNETAIYVMPQRFRSDIDSDQVRRTHLVVGDRSITVIDGRMVVEENLFDRYQRLLRSRTRSSLMRTVNQLGIETAITSLGRVDDRVVFVLGARYPDESISQLAIDKETFLPLRLLLVENGSDAAGQTLEIFYRDWRKIENGGFPFQVQFYTNGRLDREIQVADYRLKPSIPSTAMDLETLKASVALFNSNTPQDRKQEAVNEVQRAVDEFRKKFE